ncbi:DUF4062 domain-containing protein [Thalassomonas sp. RHCl1]|uniref:DUF4062 domain-containing protein n=1 Tax=Thalassomonas sp. RHCl1 TaxID=2995320 RepID=UPI00248B85AF|nr:DUF4062 domain-containing protein [Thalassomonas sp. RHCl1]
MDKRYQVFVSSTYVDLQEERQKVLQTLMEMDCIPAGMELFPAADEEQWEFIKRVIDDCDYYLLIIGGRYGSKAEDGLSYTEKEFDYAVSKGIKVIALLHQEPNTLPRDKTELEPEGYEKLQSFIKKVSTNRLVRFWKEASQLPGEVALSLNKTIKMYPSVGWVRADSTASPELLAEINELRKHNEELKENLKQLSVGSSQIDISELADWESSISLKGTYKLNALNIYSPTEYGNWTTTITWSKIYSKLSPFVAGKPREDEVNRFLAKHLSKVNQDVDGLSELVINQQDLFTIRIQFLALSLISVDVPAVGDAIWSLTEHGTQKMLESRIVKANGDEVEYT